jgi:membrane protease YdiL (CAAX protease family)
MGDLKNGKLYFYLIFIYILMQVSSVFVALSFFNHFSGIENVSLQEAEYRATAWSLFITNAIAGIIILFLVVRNKHFLQVFKGKKVSIGNAVLWGFIGFFLALGGQMLAASIEIYILGIEAGSDNTAQLGEIAKASPIIILSIVLFAPLFEELIFRRIIFGGIYQKSNFIIAALVSGIIFAAVHNEFEHILMYMAPGFVFAYLYYRTKRLLTPIIAHLLMNSFVTIIQLNQDKLQQIQNMKQTFSFFF